jgi:hypothetical protein
MTPEETTATMYGTDIGLKYQVSEARFRDFRAEVERQRLTNIALDPRPRTPRVGIAAAQAGLATLLLRVGSWLMPPEASAEGRRPVAFALPSGE